MLTPVAEKATFSLMQTIDEFDKQFPTEEACREYLMQKRWPNGVHCPRCGKSEKIYALKSKPFYWVCKNADCGKRNGYRFSLITRTIFQDTKIPLRVWFKVGYLMLTAKKGLSSLQVHRVIFGEDSGSDWRTAWYMCLRWRGAMAGNLYPMGGIIEVDETYVGGKDKNRHWNKRSRQQREAGTGGANYGKIGVIGAIERKGNVVARVIGDTDARTLSGFVRRVAKSKMSVVVTDEAAAYSRMGLQHETVNHSRGQYVRGQFHTNTIESFWSLLKRGAVGSYHHVSKDYLPLYLNEFSFRFNNRGNPEMLAT